MAVKTPQALRDAAVEAYRERGTMRSIAKEYGVSAHSLSIWLTAAGVPIRLPGKGPALDPEEDTKIRCLLDDGVPLKEIARTSTLSYGALRRHYPHDRWTHQQTSALGCAVTRSKGKALR